MPLSFASLYILLTKFVKKIQINACYTLRGSKQIVFIHEMNVIASLKEKKKRKRSLPRKENNRSIWLVHN